MLAPWCMDSLGVSAECSRVFEGEVPAPELGCAISWLVGTSEEASSKAARKGEASLGRLHPGSPSWPSKVGPID